MTELIIQLLSSHAACIYGFHVSVWLLTLIYGNLKRDCCQKMCFVLCAIIYKIKQWNHCDGLIIARFAICEVDTKLPDRVHRVSCVSRGRPRPTQMNNFRHTGYPLVAQEKHLQL